jgi:hypothetical protein
MESALEGELLLRPAMLGPVLLHVSRKALADFHAASGPEMQPYRLQTMSLIFVDFPPCRSDNPER